MCKNAQKNVGGVSVAVGAIGGLGCARETRAVQSETVGSTYNRRITPSA